MSDSSRDNVVVGGPLRGRQVAAQTINALARRITGLPVDEAKQVVADSGIPITVQFLKAGPSPSIFKTNNLRAFCKDGVVVDTMRG